MPDALVPTNGGNGNGHGTLSGVVVPTWNPSPRDLKYVDVLRELLELDGKLSDSNIANRLGVTKQAIAKMEKRPGFMAWVNVEVRRMTDELWPKAIHRCAVLATRGSVNHFTALAKLRGELNDTPSPGGGVLENHGLVVVIHE